MKKILIVLISLVVLVSACAPASEEFVPELTKERAINLIEDSGKCQNVDFDSGLYNSDVGAWIFLLDVSDACGNPQCRVYDDETVQFWGNEEPCSLE